MRVKKGFILFLTANAEIRYIIFGELFAHPLSGWQKEFSDNKINKIGRWTKKLFEDQLE
ncbi:hypothetical protein ACFSKI_00040 [Pseudogracilibacillus auburnensis]|uniref:hypothetical protein n=1 Tax=Pseudogracilibacillus auburnensis TaxID=1494959 RepID=UPI00131425B9|nr:hypothetical protein [Pseudogracilibacillus auburnensis]MBO1005304.1 hypothetical protein [Pseudogracilibacillus auburnensis]